MDLVETLMELRKQGSDTRQVEVKAAHGGYPENTAQTMSAFANTPGGGVMVFGIDEGADFAVVGVYDVAKCQQAVVSTARNALAPPITVSTDVVSIEGNSVVVVHVPEVDRAVKPVRLVKTGRAYLRMYDGDYQLSEVEEQVLIAQRGHPKDDEAVVEQAEVDALEPTAVGIYVDQRRSSSRVFTSMTDHEVLIRTGVLSGDGRHPTLAGLLALGIYPQQFFPSLAAQGSLHTGAHSERASDARSIGGSIPAMLEDCLDWVRQSTPTAIGADQRAGSVTDRPMYPPIAVREIVANALIHRDFSEASINQPVTMRIIQHERMIVVSPGGLFGVSIDGLGKTPSSPRNARLIEILQFVRDAHSGRVVERLGSGIPAAQQALASAEMPPLKFDDRGVRFTVFIEGRHPTKKGWEGVSLAARELLEALDVGAATVQQLAERTRRPARQVRYLVGRLVDDGLLTREPYDGRTMQYRIAR